MVFDPFPFDEESSESGPLEDDFDSEAFEDDVKEMPRERLMTFIVVLVAVQAGLLAGSLGLMLLVIRGQLLVGGGLFVAGVLAFVVAYYRYRRFERDHDA